MPNDFIHPFLQWCIAYVILGITIIKKNPLDPRLWLFVGFNVLIINGFMTRNLNKHYDIVIPMMYVYSTIVCTHVGFMIKYKRISVTLIKVIRKNQRIHSKLIRVKQFNIHNYFKYRPHKFIQPVTTVCGCMGILGALLICIEGFVILGFSLDDGGDRRAQFQEALPFMVLTPIGMIFLGGGFFSALSTFLWANKWNSFLGVLNLIALAVASVAIAGKQGILYDVIIIVFSLSFKKVYNIKIKTPRYLKITSIIFVYLFAIYLANLTIGRQNIEGLGHLYERNLYDKRYETFAKKIIPRNAQDSFFEILAYYGDQFPYFCERWEIENIPKKYGVIRIPRVLGPFSWIERQVQKVIPVYSDIFPEDRDNWVYNQRQVGTYSNATWASCAFLNIKYFGLLGGLLMFLLYGFFSRMLFDSTIHHFTFTKYNYSFFNCISAFYYTMFFSTQETPILMYLIIVIILHKIFKIDNLWKVSQQ